MGRKRAGSRLNIWMNGEPVADWTLEPDGSQSFVYRDSWRASPSSRPVSLSLPFTRGNTHRGVVIESYFDNLLPDSRLIRQRIQARYQATSSKAFDLLAEIGRDCVGAIQLMRDGDVPERTDEIRYEALSEKDVEDILRDVPVVGADGEYADFRISLAGAQEKTALLRHKGRWCRPLGSTPTTHIFKLPLGRVGPFQADFSTSCENEWLSAQLIRELGLDVASCEIGHFGDQKALIVDRFDRRLSEDRSHWLRLPQEDMCQAMGISPSLKYEADGGPGMQSIMELLIGSRVSAQDRATFFRAQVAFWMLCAPDGHAKNFSISIGTNGTFQLTPLYDVLSAYPIVGKRAGQIAQAKVKMAMAAIGTNRHYLWKRILPRHWLTTARACGLRDSLATDIIHDLALRADVAVDNVARMLPNEFPAHVSDTIFDGLRGASAQLREAI